MAVPLGAGSFQPIGAGVLSVMQAGAWQQLWPAAGGSSRLLLVGSNSTLAKRVVAATSVDGETFTEVSQPTLGSATSNPTVSAYADGAWWVAGPAISSVVTFSKSVDGGATWDVSSATVPFSNSAYPHFLVKRDGRWILGMSTSGVYVSDDDTATWTRKSTEAVNVYAKQFLDDGSAIAYYGSSSNWIRSTDNGDTWTSSSWANVRSVGYDGDTGTLLAVTYSSTKWWIYSKSNLTDTSSTLIASGTYSGTFPVGMSVGGGTWIVTFANSGYMRSSDNGVTWTSPEIGPSSGYYPPVYYDGVWYWLGTTTLWRSVDGGVTWTTAATPTDFSSRYLVLEQ